MLAAVAYSHQCSSSLHEVSNTSDNSSTSPFGIPRLPRIKIGKPNRGRIVIAVAIAIVVVLILSAKSLSSFYVNVLWHQAIGRTDVLWGILGAKGLLIGAFSLVFAILLWLNMAVADRLAPAIVPDSDEQRTLIPLRAALKKRSKLDWHSTKLKNFRQVASLCFGEAARNLHGATSENSLLHNGC